MAQLMPHKSLAPSTRGSGAGTRFVCCLLCPPSLQSTRLGLLVNNIRKKATDKVLAKRLKNLVRSWKEACTTPPQGNPPLPPPPTVRPSGESSSGVVKLHSPAPAPLLNSQHVQNSGDSNLHSALPSSAPLANSQTHTLVPQLQSFLRPSTLEAEASVSPAQLPAVVPSTEESLPQAPLETVQCRTPPSPPSSPPRPVLHSLTICISLNRLPASLVDRLKHTNQVHKGNHVAVEDSLVPATQAVEFPPNTMVLPPHRVVFPLRSLTPQPHPLAPSPLTLPPSPPTVNLMVSIPLGKVCVTGAVCGSANGNSSRGFQSMATSGATLNHTPSVLPKQLELPCSSAIEESSDTVNRPIVNGVHLEERSVVCWRYAWAGGEGQYSGIHGYFDHTGQWHDWTMPLPSHKDSVGVLPYVYID